MSENKPVEKVTVSVEPKIDGEKGTKPKVNEIPDERFAKVIGERNELRDKIKAFESKEEEANKAKLIEEGNWQKLNEELTKEVETYKPYKGRFEALDGAIREKALDGLPDEKKEKFKNLQTPDLLNVVEELSSKLNPSDQVGTISQNVDKKEYLKMDIKDKRKNWGAIVDSYKR